MRFSGLFMNSLNKVEENFKKKMTRNRLLELHHAVMDDLLLHGAGAYRSSWVMIGPDKPPGPAVVPYMVENWIQRFGFKSTKPLDSHFDFECIHPFIDGNGRIGRLLWAWHILRKKGTIIPILDQFPGTDFRTRRMAYYQAIRKYRGEHYGEIRS